MNILLVEDQDDSRQALSRLIAMRGHKESGAAVGADAPIQLTGFAPPTIHALGARTASVM